MFHLFNQTDGDLSLRFEGQAYIFPAKSIVDVDSADMAREFCAKTYHPPDQRAGRFAGTNDLIEVLTIPDGIAIVKMLRFRPLPPPESLPTPLTVADLAPSPSPPSAPPPPTTSPPRSEMDLKSVSTEIRLISNMGKPALLALAKKHGVFKIADTPWQISEKLHAIGFRAF